MGFRGVWDEFSRCFGDVLGMVWRCFGSVLEVFWREGFWEGLGRVLGGFCEGFVRVL